MIDGGFTTRKVNWITFVCNLVRSEGNGSALFQRLNKAAGYSLPQPPQSQCSFTSFFHTRLPYTTQLPASPVNVSFNQLSQLMEARWSIRHAYIFQTKTTVCIMYFSTFSENKCNLGDFIDCRNCNTSLMIVTFFIKQETILHWLWWCRQDWKVWHGWTTPLQDSGH